MAVALLFTLAGCGAGDGRFEIHHEWHAVYDTVGDTVVVRTVTGSVWQAEAELVPELTIGTLDGEDAYIFGDILSITVDDDGSIYVYDGQAKALRKYSSNGEFVTTFGREGEGPGEYRNPDGGLGVLPDGRIVLRDPGNTRLQTYTSDGEPAGSWRLEGGLFSASSLVIDAAGGVYVEVIVEPMTADRSWQLGLLRYGPDGEPGDTLLEPKWGKVPEDLVASTESGMSRRPAPFVPNEVTTLSPEGYFLGGVSDRYAIHLPQPDGPVLRIERETKPVPVRSEERDHAERITIREMRRTQPDWRWNGPSIPSTKPAFKTIHVGQDGRLWVQVSQPAERIPDDEIEESDDDEIPPQRWREPIAYDLFEPDGRYLGRVHAPSNFSLFPEPVFRGDHVWAVVRGEFDEPYVTRFRIEHDP